MDVAKITKTYVKVWTKGRVASESIPACKYHVVVVDVTMTSDTNGAATFVTTIA